MTAMVKTRVLVSGFLIAVMVVGLVLVSGLHFGLAQTTPSVPEFTLKFEEHPYDLPPVYGIDQYTGANVTIQEGQHIPNQTITITTKNQPLYSSFNGDTYYLYYNVRAKGYFGENWNEFYQIDPYHSYDSGTYGTSLPNGLLSSSNSELTVTTVPVSYPSGSQVDFQAESIVWRGFQYFVPDTYLFPNASGHYEQRFAFYAASGWSDTQTITIPSSPSITPSISPTQPASTTPIGSPYPSATIPKFPTWIILPVICMGLLLTVMHAKTKNGKIQ